MSYYYLNHETIRLFLSKATHQASFEDALSWLSLATEFDELPVRHNEDLINAELAKNLRYNPSILGLPLWDPHVKAFLLLQAHFDHINLPISDYVGDLTSVLDQSIRVCQAAIDVFAERGYWSTVKMMITLMQCIKSAQWPTDPPVSIFPGVNIQFAEADVQSVIQKDLRWLTSASPRELDHMAGTLTLRRGTMPHFVAAIKEVPKLVVSLIERKLNQVTLEIRRQNPFKNRDGRMYAPRFPKPQTEGFFVLLCQQGADELLALKRIGWSTTSKTFIKSTLELQKDVAEIDLVVLVVSDGYPGLEWTVLAKATHVP